MRTSDATHYRHIRRGTGTSIINNPSGIGQGQIANGATEYFEIGGADDGITSCQIRWFDNTSSATITLETCNLPASEVTYNSTTAQDWCAEPVTITGPTGVAAGTFMLHFGNSGSKRHRLKVVTAAITQLELVSYGVH